MSLAQAGGALASVSPEVLRARAARRQRGALVATQRGQVVATLVPFPPPSQHGWSVVVKAHLKAADLLLDAGASSILNSLLAGKS